MSLDFSPSRDPMTEISLAGMTDIVLLLLIFFLLTSSFIPQMGIQVTLPQVDSSAPVEEESVTVALTEEGTYFVNGTRVAASRLLNEIRAARTSERTLILRADQGATIGQFASVASAARALDMRILVATERRGRGR
jgi:biopolymer transport protein ExbD